MLMMIFCNVEIELSWISQFQTNPECLLDVNGILGILRNCSHLLGCAVEVSCNHGLSEYGAAFSTMVKWTPLSCLELHFQVGMICMMLYDLVINKPYFYPYIYIYYVGISGISHICWVYLFFKDMSFFHSYVEGNHAYMFMFIHMGMGS